MKYNKIFRTLALAIILALLVIAIPTKPAQAQAIMLSPASGTAGTTVTVTGYTFTGYIGQPVYILFDYNYVAVASVLAGGTFTTSFIVPAAYTTAITVLVTVQHTTPTYDATKQIAIKYFTVTARQITISPSSGYVGSTVTISGTGFAANQSVTITFDATTVTTSPASVIINTLGSFTATFTVPTSVRGSHTVKAQDDTGNYATDIFTTLQKITVTPPSGGVGDTVTISGTGFAANKNVTFYLDNVSVSADPTTTDPNGSFTNNTFTIPSTSRGSHTIKARDASGYYATAIFTIAEKIAITPTTGASGKTVTVTGTGFSADKPITIKYNNVAVSTSSTNAYGSFTGSFNVPAGLAGTYSVEASDGTYSASANFVATADVTLSQTTSEASPGYVGMELTITGTGFKPNATVTITYTTDPVVLATTTTDANGAFSVTITIPPSIGGNHTLTVTDDHTTKQFTFVMESTPPPIPAPLLPLMDSKTEAEAYFDWEDVDDPSLPITYTLQIASDADFTTIVLEKEGLTDSEYTITKEERLESVKKEAPYYWRVRAIDGTSKVGAWSGVGSFNVGFVFVMPSWAIYTLLGILALLLGALGFWLGRRTTYYEL